MQNETSNLASLSTAIRESSLKRLRVVPVEQENWQPVSGAMSIAGIAQHILDADLWLFRKLENPLLQAIKASADASHVRNHQEYLDILVNLEQTGRQRSSLIQALTQEQLARLIPDERFGPQVSVWWVIVRGNLDHETHHRGQLASYLRIMQTVDTQASGAT